MKIPKLQFKGHIAEIINYLFQGLLAAYLIMLLIEQVWTGSVSLYFNLNYLLILVIIAGILDVFSEHKKQEKQKIRWWDYVFISVLGILGFIIIKFKTGELGGLSWLISVIAGILIMFLSILVLEEDKEEIKQVKEKIYKNKKLLWGLSIFSLILVLNMISLVISGLTSLSIAESYRIIFGSIYVLFLPGFIISFIFFPKTKEFESEEGEGKDKEREKGAIDWIERIALSFALSIAIVPLVVFYLNLICVKISLVNSFLTILGIILVSGIILYFRMNKLKN